MGWFIFLLILAAIYDMAQSGLLKTIGIGIAVFFILFIIAARTSKFIIQSRYLAKERKYNEERTREKVETDKRIKILMEKDKKEKEIKMKEREIKMIEDQKQKEIKMIEDQKQNELRAKAAELELIRQRKIDDKRNLLLLVKQANDRTSHIQYNLNEVFVYLNKADYEFKEQAYMLFWENMVLALRYFRYVEKDINNLPDQIRKYSILYHRVSKYEVPPILKLSYSLEKINSVMVRIKEIDRKAQKVSECVLIFLQMRTNSILIDILEGVSNITDAVSNVGVQIGYSIDNLAASIAYAVREFDRSVNSIEYLLSKSIDIASSGQIESTVKYDKTIINNYEVKEGQLETTVKQEKAMNDHFKIVEKELRSIRQQGIDQGIFRL